MIYTAICDDDIQMSKQMEQYLIEISKEKGMEILIERFEDGQELEAEIKAGNRYDIIYLDIEMKYKDGIETAQAIRQIDKTVILIYVSSYESYAVQTFAARPFRFIVKPVAEQIFRQYFLQAYEEIIESLAYFEYVWNKARYRIPIKEIIYFESQLRLVEMVLPSGRKQMYEKLDAIDYDVPKNHVCGNHKSDCCYFDDDSGCMEGLRRRNQEKNHFFCFV